MLIKKALSSESKKLWGIILNLAVCVLLGFGLHAFIAKMSDGNMAESVNLIISIIVAAVIFVVLQFATMKKDANVLSFVYAGISGAFINTLLVMGGIFVLYKDAYANALSIDANAVLGVIGGVISFNGVIEAIVAAVIVYAIGAVLTKIKPIK